MAIMGPGVSAATTGSCSTPRHVDQPPTDSLDHPAYRTYKTEPTRYPI